MYSLGIGYMANVDGCKALKDMAIDIYNTETEERNKNMAEKRIVLRAGIKGWTLYCVRYLLYC